jgi:hypothetical protein
VAVACLEYKPAAFPGILPLDLSLAYPQMARHLQRRQLCFYDGLEDPLFFTMV